MAKKIEITPGHCLGTGKGNIKMYPTFTFEGNICFKDGEIYGRIIEDNESRTIVEVKGVKEGEYPDRHEFRKDITNGQE